MPANSSRDESHLVLEELQVLRGVVLYEKIAGGPSEILGSRRSFRPGDVTLAV